jgi:putative acetyltransferase
MVRLMVRDETPADHAAVYEIVDAAFGEPGEAKLVDRLRSDGAAVVSLVAEEAGDLLGHIMLSEMTAPFRALGLAPVSVAPARQSQGIGSRLIEAAIGRARVLGYDAIFVLGDQRYYARFGFDVAAASGFTSPYAGPHLAMLTLTDQPLPREGRVDYAPAFEEAGL